jgi:Immunity protein 44
MQVWTSSEAQFDVDEALTAARKDLERELRSSVASQDFGTGVSKWALIYILLPEDDSNYPEVWRFHKRTSVVEFRLKVDHKSFKESNTIDQRKLLGEAVLRSIELSRKLRIPNFDTENFRLFPLKISATCEEHSR